MTGKKKALAAVAAALLVAVLGAAAAWRWVGGGDPCLMYGTAYTLIKEVKIGGATHYLYRSESGSHDKAAFISLTPEPLPGVVCDYANLKTPIYSTDIEPDRHLEKLSITRKPGGGFGLEPVYAGAAAGAEPQDLSRLPIEVGGGR